MVLTSPLSARSLTKFHRNALPLDILRDTHTCWNNEWIIDCYLPQNYEETGRCLTLRIFPFFLKELYEAILLCILPELQTGGANLKKCFMDPVKEKDQGSSFPTAFPAFLPAHQEEIIHTWITKPDTFIWYCLPPPLMPASQCVHCRGKWVSSAQYPATQGLLFPLPIALGKRLGNKGSGT